VPRLGNEEVVLISGFPSRYAKRIAEHVLASEPRSFVDLVVPAARRAEADEFVAALGPDARRMRVIEGEPTAMDLGLSGSEFRALSREVDLIHHAAHASFTGLDAKEMESANLAAAAEILEFARAASWLKALVFHSTASVSGDRTGVVYEEDFDRGQSFHDEAERARMKAEAMARRAIKDVPLVIVRPSRIVGVSSPDERLDALHLAALLVATTPAEITLPLPSRGDAPVHAVPMDFVARSSHALGKTAGAAGKTFHLVDPHALSARRFFELVARSARRPSLGAIPAAVAGMLLRAPGIERLVRSPKSFIGELAAPVRYDARNTKSALAGAGIECPPFETYVDELVAEVESHVRARRTRRASVRPPAEVEVDDPLS
jgi:nucleoside-diphosphate-sugar epimerase